MTDGYIHARPRRLRRLDSLRSLVRETTLASSNLVWPVFVVDGSAKPQAIASMPGVFRWNVDDLVVQCQQIHKAGVSGVALFPCLPDSQKDSFAKESTNPNGLLPRTIKAIKSAVPDLVVFTDVAMDPYSSDGHDGLVKDGQILNDETLTILADMALVQAEAGADFVAPSDMMDGRIGFIRQKLDINGHTNVGILSYCAKYASAFYGPFRDALDSSPRFGDKKTYQMDPANRREASRELELDIEEGADIVMVKPAMAYLDIISDFRAQSPVPVAAYQVSGEYSMILAASQNGWLDRDKAMMESLTAIRRAGADIIFSYFAKDAASLL